jgi:hypothetical protein
VFALVAGQVPGDVFPHRDLLRLGQSGASGGWVASDLLLAQPWVRALRADPMAMIYD